MKRFILLLTLCCSLSAMALDLPEKTNRMVNDFAGVFDASWVSTTEQKLEQFSDSTSNQICVITVSDLQDLEASDYAQRIGQAWGVGSNNSQVKDNGVIILIKPRNGDEGGDVAIATGYGIEGVLTDALCKRIINRKMIPALKEEHYADAVDSALTVIMPVMQGEYDIDNSDLAEATEADKEDLGIGIATCIIVLVIILLLLKANRKNPLLDKIEHAQSPEALTQAVEKAREAKIPEKKINQAKAQVPKNMLTSLEESESPSDFTGLAANAILLGVPATQVASLECEMPERTLAAIGKSTSKNEIDRQCRRARAFGNSEDAVKAAEAAALAALAALAIAAARSARRNRHDDFGGGYGGGSFGGGSSFGGFGGGSFGGGGASGHF